MRKLLSSHIPSVSLLNPNLTLFLLQLIVILSFCRILSLLGQFVTQPRVIFEIIGGILLGPSGLGHIKVYQ